MRTQECECKLLRHSSSDEYQAAQATLARSFQGKFDKFVVPCVVASGDTKDRKGTEPLSFRCSALVGGRGVFQKVTIPPVLPAQIWGPGGKGTVAGVGRTRAGRWGTVPSTHPPPSPHNTLYLELWCPAVPPSIVVTSNKGQTISNFGDIAVGEP